MTRTNSSITLSKSYTGYQENLHLISDLILKLSKGISNLNYFYNNDLFLRYILCLHKMFQLFPVRSYQVSSCINLLVLLENLRVRDFFGHDEYNKFHLTACVNRLPLFVLLEWRHFHNSWFIILSLFLFIVLLLTIFAFILCETCCF